MSAISFDAAARLLYEAECNERVWLSHASRPHLKEIWDRLPVVPDIYERIYTQIASTPERLHMNHYHALIVDRAMARARFGRPTRREAFTQPMCDDGPIDYRDCGTAHCMAGWVITLMGNLGLYLEQDYFIEDVAALLLLKSTGGLLNFHASDTNAMLEIETKLFDQEELT